MKEYEFSIEEKVKTWRRSNLKIKANSYEEALEEVKSFIRHNSVQIPYNNFCYSELIYELEENILVSENKNEPTIIIFAEGIEKEVYDNATL